MCSLGTMIGLAPEGSTVSGWRRWRLGIDEAGTPLLRSTVIRAIWPGPTLEADELPLALDGNRSGIHAWTTPFRPGWRTLRKDVVSGEVVLSGRIVLHERGVLAEHCRIERLVLHPCGLHGPEEEFCGCTHGPQLSMVEMSDIASRLAARYGCKVEFAERAPWRRHARRTSGPVDTGPGRSVMDADVRRYIVAREPGEVFPELRIDATDLQPCT